MTHTTPYRGRFAPSPTGLLHAGSLVTALASRLDALSHNGTWLIRIEDIDPPREMKGATEHILATLDRMGFVSTEPVLYQHDRYEAYEAALETLKAHGMAYGCGCSRKAIQEASLGLGLPAGVYPGTCREGVKGDVRAWRFRTTNTVTTFTDRECGEYSQNVEREVGDFVLKRADGFWAYQLAVVVDDIASGITHIVRGQDLLDNTPRQLLLYDALGAARPTYYHVPLVLNDEGQKLSKQSGATPLNPDNLLGELELAATRLGLPRIGANSFDTFWDKALLLWNETKAHSL